jgi:APA family basic amino acid/polyamine antiporter
MLPWNEIDVHAPFGQGFQALGMHWVSVLVSVGAVTGITTSLLVSLIGQARVYVTLARDHLIPSNLATIHPKYGTPLVAQMTTGALSAFLALLIDIEVSVGTHSPQTLTFPLPKLVILSSYLNALY